MNHLKKYIVFSIILLSFILFSIILFGHNKTLAFNASPQSICGDWLQFNDLKCIKIMSEDILHNFDDSEQVCSQKNSVLLTIYSAKEQEFISEFLFKTKTIVDNVWIGLKRNTSSDAFEWRDASDSQYRNWINGRPSNTTDYNCVQINTDFGQTGKWVDIQCSKKNIVICQKAANYLISDLQKIIFETKEKLIITENNIISNQKDHNQTKEHLLSSQNNAFAIEVLLNETRDKLIYTQNKVMFNEKEFNKTKEELQQLNEKLIENVKKLNETQVMLNDIKDNLFNKWLIYKLFTDSDGKCKAFFIPLNECYKNVTFDEALNTCNKYNATLVEPNTAQKQHIFQTFLAQLGLESFKMPRFWINGKRASSGKFQWISSGEDFTYTNWYPNFPNSVSNADYVYIVVYRDQKEIPHVGKWANELKTKKFSVVCEQDIYGLCNT